jgi:hypothetical protein
MKKFLCVLAMLALSTCRHVPGQAGEPTDYKIKHLVMLYTTVLLSPPSDTQTAWTLGDMRPDGRR